MKCPKELEKKLRQLVDLKKHFEYNIEEEITKKVQTDNTDDEFEIIYVKKWMKTHNTVMFRLNNKILHTCFNDHTEVILNSKLREVTYINKRGVKKTHPISEVDKSNNREIAKRIKYIKEILTQIRIGTVDKIHMLAN